jgi:hypothetical protein
VGSSWASRVGSNAWPGAILELEVAETGRSKLGGGYRSARAGGNGGDGPRRRRDGCDQAKRPQWLGARSSEGGAGPGDPLGLGPWTGAARCVRPPRGSGAGGGSGEIPATLAQNPARRHGEVVERTSIEAGKIYSDSRGRSDNLLSAVGIQVHAARTESSPHGLIPDQVDNCGDGTSAWIRVGMLGVSLTSPPLRLSTQRPSAAESRGTNPKSSDDTLSSSLRVAFTARVQFERGEVRPTSSRRRAPGLSGPHRGRPTAEPPTHRPWGHQMTAEGGHQPC